MRNVVLSLLMGIIVIFNLSAQTDTVHQDGADQASQSVAETVDVEFEKLIKESNNFQSYKVVKLDRLLELQRDTKKQIGSLESEIGQLNTQITDLQKQLDQSVKDLEKTNSSLKAAEKSRNEFSFLGIKMMKTTYQIIVIFIIVILLGSLILFFGKFKTSNKGTIKAQNDLRDLQADYDEYRKKALETQQKLGRQLQDERNKNINK